VVIGDNVVRCWIRPLKGVQGVVVVAEDWPCWLPALVGMNIVVEALYAPRCYVDVFGEKIHRKCTWNKFVSLDAWPEGWSHHSVLASGTLPFCKGVLAKLGSHVGPYLYAVDMDFPNMHQRQIASAFSQSPTSWVNVLRDNGLKSAIVSHAEFGGVTSARHLIAYHNVDGGVLNPRRSIQRTLSHVINPTASGRSVEIPHPPALTAGTFTRAPIWDGKCLRGEGTLDVLRRDPDVACKSVFKQSGWVQRQLSLEERLRAFDLPVWLYSGVRNHAIARKSMERGISSLVVASVFRAMWAESGLGGVE
jgi:hypothetical protein